MARRNFGSVFTRKARGVTWYWIRFQLGGRNVRRKVGTTKKQADDALAAIRTAHAGAEKEKLQGIVGPARLKFADLWDTVLPTLSARLTPANVEIQRRQSTVARTYFGEEVLVREIGVPEIEGLLDHLITARGCSPATRNRYRASLSAWWKVAIAGGFARENVAKKIKALKEQRRAIPFLSDSDVDRIIARGPEESRGYFRILADTGIRRSEGIRLAWHDVDLRRGVILVRVSKNRGTREIPLTARAREALVALLVERGPIPLEGPARVFPWVARYKDLAHAERRVTLLFRAVAKKAEVPLARLHDLRHSFCSRLVQRGVPLSSVMHLAGHSSLSVTSRYASHVPGGAAAAAIAALEAPAPVVTAPGNTAASAARAAG